MNFSSYMYLVLIIITLLLSACEPTLFFSSGLKVATSSAEERGLGGVISDTALKNTIQYRLLKHSVKLFSKISTTVHQGQALVTGVVETPQLKADALSIIKNVGGIKEIIDEITVADISLPQVGIDGWITTQLTSGLTVDPDIQSINYEVKTQNGVVYITGIAQDQQELAKVTDIARNIANVKKVISHVKLKDAPLFTPSKDADVESTTIPLIENAVVTVANVNDLPDESPLAGLE